MAGGWWLVARPAVWKGSDLRWDGVRRLPLFAPHEPAPQRMGHPRVWVGHPPQVEHNSEEDDDWITLEFGEPDAAVIPFTKKRTDES